MVCLIKPQFEAGPGKVGKKGVVREKAVHIEVIEKILTFVLEHGFSVRNRPFPQSKDRKEILNILSTFKSPNGQNKWVNGTLMNW